MCRIILKLKNLLYGLSQGKFAIHSKSASQSFFCVCVYVNLDSLFQKIIMKIMYNIPILHEHILIDVNVILLFKFISRMILWDHFRSQ